MKNYNDYDLKAVLLCIKNRLLWWILKLCQPFQEIIKCFRKKVRKAKPLFHESIVSPIQYLQSATLWQTTWLTKNPDRELTLALLFIHAFIERGHTLTLRNNLHQQGLVLNFSNGHDSREKSCQKVTFLYRVFCSRQDAEAKVNKPWRTMRDRFLCWKTSLRRGFFLVLKAKILTSPKNLTSQRFAIFACVCV